MKGGLPAVFACLAVTVALGAVNPPWEKNHLLVGQTLYRENCVVCHDIDKPQAETCLGNETNLHSPRGANKEDFGLMALNQFVGYREGWNDVAAGAASGNENSQFRQSCAFQEGLF